MLTSPFIKERIRQFFVHQDICQQYIELLTCMAYLESNGKYRHLQIGLQCWFDQDLMYSVINNQFKQSCVELGYVHMKNLRDLDGTKKWHYSLTLKGRWILYLYKVSHGT